jgi:hypothetical protein
MLPLLGMMAMGGAGLLSGRNFLENQQRTRQAEAGSLVQGLLGQAPTGVGELGFGGMGPPSPGTGGTGLLADPNDPRAQLQFAAGLMGNPQTAAAGQSLLINMVNNQAHAGLTREQGSLNRGQNWAELQARLAQSDQQYQQTFQANQERFQFERGRLSENDAFERAKVRQELALRQREDARKQAEFDYQTRLRAAGGGVDLGSVPAGSARVMGPNGPEIVPLRGSDDWRKERAAQDNLRLAVNSLRSLGANLEKFGTDMTGPGAAEMTVQYGQATDAIRQLREMGVLQPAELATIERQIVDPTSWKAKTTKNSNIKAGFDALDAILSEKMSMAEQRTRGWQGFQQTENALPPGFEEYNRERQGRKRR